MIGIVIINFLTRRETSIVEKSHLYFLFVIHSLCEVRETHRTEYLTISFIIE